MTKNRKFALAFILIVLIGVFSRFVNIDTQGILVDETWVVPNTFLHFGEQSIFPKLFTYPQFTNLSPDKQDWIRAIYNLHPVFQIAAYQASDVHPPLFHILNYYWGRWFGYAEGTIRVPAAIYFLLTMALLPMMLRRMGMSPITTLVALAFVVLSPIYLFFSNFARPYTLLLLLSLLSSYMCYEMAQKGFRKSTMFLYIITATASLYTHYYAALTVVTQGLYLLMETWIHRQRMKDVLKVGFLEAMVLVLYLPWLFVMVYQILYRYPLVTFEAVGLHSVVELFLSFGLGYSRSTLYSPANIAVSVIQLALGCFGAIALWKDRKDSSSRFWLFFFFVLGGLIVALNVAKPSFTVRNCLNLLIPYLVLCSVGLTRLKPVWLKFAASAIMGIVGLYFIFYGLSYGHLNGARAMEDWRSAAAFIRNLNNPSTVYVYQPSYREPLYYYIPDQRRIKGLEIEDAKAGPADQRFILVLVKSEQMPLEDKIERDTPFLRDTERFVAKSLAVFPRIYIYEVTQRRTPSQSLQR